MTLALFDMVLSGLYHDESLQKRLGDPITSPNLIPYGADFAKIKISFNLQRKKGGQAQKHNTGSQTNVFPYLLIGYH